LEAVDMFLHSDLEDLHHSLICPKSALGCSASTDPALDHTDMVIMDDTHTSSEETEEMV
jgi:hypothetical protein